MEQFGVKELALLIKSNLPKDKINLTAEVREPKIRNGNMYLTLKDNDGCINAIVWRSNITDEIKELKEGHKINVVGCLNYYQSRSTLSFIISKLKSIDGKGEVMIEYDKTFKYYNDKGYFLESKKIKPPELIKNILILTSEEGAALQDFYYGLNNGGIKVNQELVNVIVQGNDCPSNIIKYLEDNFIKNSNDTFDLIVLTRGGGSFEDLFGFCKPELIECISKLKTPVLTAIGHQVDTTLVDYVADIVAPTPSLAAQYIVDHNKKYIDELNHIKNNYMETVREEINDLMMELHNSKNKLVSQYESIKEYFYEDLKNKIMDYKLNLIRIKNKYQNKNVSIVCNDKIIESDIDMNNLLKKQKEFTIVINNKMFKIFNYDFS